MIAVVIMTSLSVAADDSATLWLNKALDAHGGGERIAGLTGLSFDVSGDFRAPLQAHGYHAPFPPLSVQAAYRFDWGQQRSVTDYHLAFPGGFTLDTSEISSGGTVTLDRTSHTFSRNMPLAITPGAVRFHPIALLRQLIHKETTINDAGETAYHGARAQRLLAKGPGLPASLEVFVDVQSHLIIGYQMPRPNALAPAGVNQVHFLDYQKMNGVAVPLRVKGEYPGEPRLGFDAQLSNQQINASLPTEAVTVPKAYREIPPTSGLGPFVREVGRDVYVVERLLGQDYNAMILVFDDHVILVEAPLNEQATVQAMQAAERLAPNKPLKTLLLTHHHDDHIGGLAAAADKGMNVLGAAGAKAVLNEVLKAARPDKTLVFDGVSPGKKHVLEDAHHRVEIYNIGDNPHAQELLTVYIPEEKLLFQADMFTNREYQEATAPANEGGIAFVRWLKKQNLMTEHIAGAHGTVASRADINLMLARAGEALQL